MEEEENEVKEEGSQRYLQFLLGTENFLRFSWRIFGRLTQRWLSLSGASGVEFVWFALLLCFPLRLFSFFLH